MSTSEKPYLHPLSPLLNGEVIDTENNERASEYLKSLGRSEVLGHKTRTRDTEKEYQQRWAYILDDIKFHSEDMIYEWFLRAQFTYLPSSFRKYKAAAAWAGAVHEDLIARIQPLKSTKKPGDRISRRTSSKKRKAIDAQDFTSLAKHLAQQDSRVSRATLLFCCASLMSGLRPSEWASARVDHNEITLSNGKNSNGRASGDTRSLALSQDSEVARKQRKILSEFIDMVPQTGPAQFNSFMKGIYRCLRRASLQLFGENKTVCLYTFRHQYSSNMKKRYEKETVALAMGHHSKETAGLHYARAVQSWQDDAFVLGALLVDQDIDPAMEIGNKKQ